MHVPVLQKEVIEYLKPEPNENFIDCTIGGGGHTLTILEKTRPKGKVLGIELDSEIYLRLKTKCSTWNVEQEKRMILVNDSYVNLKDIVRKKKFKPVQGILFDLGLSSWHLEESGRGFSFQKNEPLEMRYNSENPKAELPLPSSHLYGNEVEKKESSLIMEDRQLTAEKILNEYPLEKIEKIFREYGEERFAGRIAQEIIAFRKLKPIKNTFQLVEIIKKSVPYWYQRRRGHFATKTFQALRIAVNDELNSLKKALPQALEVIRPQGRIVVISFHSLEDRIVKDFFRSRAAIDLRILTKKPIRPSWEEIKANPRSRSAMLRAAIKYRAFA